MRPSSPTFPLFLLRNRPTAAHLRAIFFPLKVYRNLSESIRAYQRKSDTFQLVLINSDKFRYHLTNIPLATYPQIPLHTGTFPHTSQQQCAHRSAPLSTNLGTNGSTSAHLRSRFYDGNGAFLPYEQIVVPMLSEGMHGGIGEKSIEYPRKVYRVSEESL